MINFIRESFNELKKVEWLDRKLTVQYSIIVITVLIAFAGFITYSDEFFLILRRLIINI